MDFSKRNKHALHIDTEALSTLALVQAGLIAPVTKLMNKEEAQEVDRIKSYKGIPFPFSFLLAPTGKVNAKVLKKLQANETIDLVVDNNKVGELVVDETFEIDKQERLVHIFGTTDTTHPGVAHTMERLGNIAVSGSYRVTYPLIEESIRRMKATVTKTGAENISAMVLAANPLNRAHERIIRQAVSESDLVVIFLRKPFNTEGIRYDIRYSSLVTFVENFLPRNKVLILPFENSYIFAGYNELILDALLAKNYGCNQIIVGKNYGGLGLFYDQNRLSTIFDSCKDIDICIKTIDEFVYCDTCKTLVSTETCPHGQHHHIHYHARSILNLIQAGVIPPPILVRKEVSANIISALFPERFKNMQEMHHSLMPGSGLLEQQSEEQFYLKLIELYQTSSLT
jgi:sulfate adenylyltransferase